ncbi:MAG: LysE/ArgO family amino acid transporter [Ornithinimicrobium sp.]
MHPLALALTGLLTGWGLIVAIGAQNAFLLRQGLRGEHVAAIVAFCVISDVVLIGMSIAGIGAALAHWPALVPIARWGGGLFIIGYGLHAGRRAFHPLALQAETSRAMSLTRALTVIGALTWLNPHLYLDIMLLGTIANSHGPLGRWWFFAGLVLASTTWFVGVGYGARLLRPFFARPRSWQILDSLIAVVMVTLGVTLIARG